MVKPAMVAKEAGEKLLAALSCEEPDADAEGLLAVISRRVVGLCDMLLSGARVIGLNVNPLLLLPLAALLALLFLPPAAFVAPGGGAGLVVGAPMLVVVVVSAPGGGGGGALLSFGGC